MELAYDYSGLCDLVGSKVGSFGGYLRFSDIPLVIEKGFFNRLCHSNEVILGGISALYENGIYPHLEEVFIESIVKLPDPEESIILARLDYMMNAKGEYVCFDLNTQPGTPGSMIWGACDFRDGMGVISLNSSKYMYFNVFSRLCGYYKGKFSGLPKVALFEKNDTSLSLRLQNMLERMCEVISQFGFFKYDFIRTDDLLEDYDVIEPFFNINGNLDIVYSNYLKAIESGKPLASNLKLLPYESKDFAFLELLDRVFESNKVEELKSFVAKESETNFVEKNLFGMGGSGLRGGFNNSWSKKKVRQEVLKPKVIDARVDEVNTRLICELGVTSLMHFKNRHIKSFIPCVDLTVKASLNHPISGPDTVIIPVLVTK